MPPEILIKGGFKNAEPLDSETQSLRKGGTQSIKGPFFMDEALRFVQGEKQARQAAVRYSHLQRFCSGLIPEAEPQGWDPGVRMFSEFPSF